MTDTPIPVNLAPDGQAIVADLPCHRCGYNLRGLTVDMLCPECGATVARSMFGNWLRFADANWLNRLRLGMLVKLWSLLVILVLSFGVGILTVFGVRMEVAQAVSLVGTALGAYGVFLLTTPEPSIAGSEDPMTLRRLYRSAIVAGLLIAPVVIALRAAGYHLISAAIGAISGIVGIVAMFCEFIYLRRLARRVPDERLASQTSIVMWGYGIAGGLGVIAGLALAVAVYVGAITPGAAGPAFAGAFSANAITPPGGASPTGAVPPTTPGARAGPPIALGVGMVTAGCLFAGAMAVFGIWYLVLQFGYLRAFREARDFSASLAAPPPLPADPR